MDVTVGISSWEQRAQPAWQEGTCLVGRQPPGAWEQAGQGLAKGYVASVLLLPAATCWVELTASEADK